MRPSLGIVSALVAVWAAMPLCETSRSYAAEVRAGVDFYLLKDEQMNFETARSKPLSELVLRDKPWIAAADIERYDWSSHHVYLNRQVPIPVPTGQKHVLLRGTPFVVVADGQRCYLGALWALVSSFSPAGNVAMVNVFGGELDRLAITWHSALKPGEARTDPRAHAQVSKALRRQGRFHAGLQCSLDKVRVAHQGATSSVIYTYTLRNIDEDDLYVLDPQRIDPAFFHDFQNGVWGRDVDDGTRFAWPNPRKGGPQPTPWEKLDLAWFSRLKKGEAMTRTVSMDALPRIFAGKYECVFVYRGYPGRVSNDQLQLRDGRIWLGQITATLIADVPEK